eukprot:GAHX01002138.1.p1 GENE.GAHX01002138.1~~GAHX01002138.1.p1  ORF type:complete len:289 (-),score=34.58 GAHX01002138.1:35-901(-)
MSFTHTNHILGFNKLQLILSVVLITQITTWNLGEQQSFVSATLDDVGSDSTSKTEFVVFYVRASSYHNNPFKTIKLGPKKYDFEFQDLEFGFIHFIKGDAAIEPKKIHLINERSTSDNEVALWMMKEKGSIKSYAKFKFPVDRDKAQFVDGGGDRICIHISIDMSKYQLNLITIYLEEEIDGNEKIQMTDVVTGIDFSDYDKKTNHGSSLSDYQLANTIERFIDIIDGKTTTSSSETNTNSVKKSDEKGNVLVIIFGLLSLVFLIATLILGYMLLKNRGQAKQRIFKK